MGNKLAERQMWGEGGGGRETLPKILALETEKKTTTWIITPTLKLNPSVNQWSCSKYGHNLPVCFELQWWMMGRKTSAEHYDVTGNSAF